MSKKPVYADYNRAGDGQNTQPMIGRASTLEDAAALVRAKYHGVRYVTDSGDHYLGSFVSCRGACAEIKVEG